MEKFTAAKATVIGVSLDSIARLDISRPIPRIAPESSPRVDEDGAIAKSYQLMVRERARRRKDTAETKSATASRSARRSS